MAPANLINHKINSIIYSSLRNGRLFALTWATWVTCLRGWHAYVGGMLAWVVRMACYYYCYCCYWDTTLKICWMFTICERDYNMFDRDLNTIKPLNISGFWICHVLWICFPDMPGFIIWWKEVKVGASYIDIKNETFCL